MKRSRLKPKPPRRGPMPQEIVDAVMRRSKGVCEDPSCRRPVEEIHHRLLRGQGGPDTEANCVGICSALHWWAHANPAAANAMGLILRSWEDPETRSVEWT